MHSEKITVRPYGKNDWLRLTEIHDSARKIELHLANLDDAFVPLEKAAENEGLFDYTVDVALLGEKIAGFSAYSDEELAWLYVDPAYARRGVGRALIEEALRNEPGINSVEVLVGNLPARKLYEKTGFELVSTESGQMPGNESFKVTVWCMKKINKK